LKTEGVAKLPVPEAAVLKIDGVEPPSAPNGELSEPANAARLDEANAEAEEGL
jgi:hypothetical protein